jgi:hypothetical protein
MKRIVAAMTAALALTASTPALARAAKKAGTRPKFLHTEKVYRGDQTRVDLDETAVDGAPKTPVGSFVASEKIDKSYDFIRIRLRWHPEMVSSTSSLSVR